MAGGTTPRRSSASGRLTKIRHGSSEQVPSDRTTAHRTRRGGPAAPSRRSATSVSSRQSRVKIEKTKRLNRIFAHKTRPYHTKREGLASARLQADQEKNGIFCRPFRKTHQNGAISGLFHHKAAGGQRPAKNGELSGHRCGQSQGHLAAIASPAAAIPQSAPVNKSGPPISKRPKQPKWPLAAGFFRALGFACVFLVTAKTNSPPPARS